MVFLDDITGTGVLSFGFEETSYWLAVQARVVVLRCFPSGRTFCYVFSLASADQVSPPPPNQLCRYYFH